MKIKAFLRVFILIVTTEGLVPGCSSQEPEGRNSLGTGQYSIQISNPGLENDGLGWKIVWGDNNWDEKDLWSQDAHTGNFSALITTNSDQQRCVLYSSIKQLKPGMKIEVTFYAKWLKDDNTVFIGFHVPQDKERGAWESLWKGSIPRDGKWNEMQAEVEVPAFLEAESSIYLHIGLPYRRQSIRQKPYTGFIPSRYLVDDISIKVLSTSEIVQPKEGVTHSFDSNDPRDNPSKFGVYWTPWRAYCRTSIKSPVDYNRSKQEIEQELDYMKQAGVKWIRSIWRWDKIEWNKGQADYAFLDYVVEEAWKRDIRFVPCLHTVPRWASIAPTGNSEYYSFPPNMDDWDNFVYQMVNHFKHRIKYWETWNEPNCTYWLGTLGDYFELQKTAYLAAKRADPRCKILIGAFNLGGFGYLDQLLHLGAKDYFDIISFHPYPVTFEKLDGAIYYIKAMRLVLAQYGCEGRPMWFTEMGWPESLLPKDSDQQRAELLTYLYEYPFHESVEKIFWFPFDRWDNTYTDGLIQIQGEDQIVCLPCFYAYRKVSGKE
jgi:hypothetical protein